jgi:tRNA(Ile)-lysidine synthase
MMSETSSEMAERLLAAVAATIGAASYPPRRERIARLREALGAARRGHTLGGCRFVRWGGRILVTRELSRAAPPLRLRPGERMIWDRRFEIMTSQADRGPFTIGYLGGYPGLAESPRLDRHMPRLRRARLPRLLFPVMPAVWDEEGIVAVPHLGYGREGIADLLQVVFRPATPLTQASFAVV